MKIGQYEQMMSYLTRPGFKDGSSLVPEPKPIDPTEKLDLYLQGYLGTSNKQFYIDKLQETIDQYQESGIMEQKDAVEYLQKKKQEYLDLSKQGKPLPSRQNFAKAGVADSANNVKKGQDLGQGIQQRVKDGNIRYVTSAVKDDTLKEHKTFKEAQQFRKELFKKYKLDETPEYKGAKNYKELAKDPDFKKFWKARVDGTSVPEVGGTQGKTKFEEGLKKILKKYKLKPNDYEGIFNKFVEETRLADAVRKGVKGAEGKKAAVSGAFMDNFLATFRNSYKPNVGTLNTAQMEKLLKLPEGELSKLMTYIGTELPREELRYAKSPEVSRIIKASGLKDKLDAAGITYEKFSRTEGKEGKDYRFKLDPDKDIAAKKYKELQKSKTFGFEEKLETKPQTIKQAIATASKQSDEYVKSGFGKDRGAADNLVAALNNSLKSMSNKELYNFVDKNPKLKNLVTAAFDPRTGDIINVDLKDMSPEQIRNSAQFEIDHIRGRATVDYDPATKKILDGLDIEYPKNLYIIPKAINSSVKKRVENFVANFPQETKKIKKIDNYFKKNQLTYFNRNTNTYGGYKPTKSAVDLAHLGITKSKELENLISGTYVDNQGVTRVKTNDPGKLIATIKELQKARGGQKLRADFFGLGSLTDSIIEDVGQGKYGKAGFKSLGAASIPFAGYFAQDEFRRGEPVLDIVTSALTGFKPTEALARTFASEEQGGYSDKERLARAQLQLLQNPPKSSLDMSPVISLAQQDPDFTGSPSEYLSYLQSKRDDISPNQRGIESVATDAEKRFQEQIMQPMFKEKALSRNTFLNQLKNLYNLNQFGIPSANYSVAFQSGGRVGFADGPDDPSKRKFMKIMGGLASLPILGKFIKPATKVAPAALEAAKGMPEWFGTLVNKVIQKGTDMTKSLGYKDRQEVYGTKIGDDEMVIVYRDLDDGSVRVEYQSPENMGEASVDLTYKPAQSTEDGFMPAEFKAVEAEPRNIRSGPDDYDIEFDGENVVESVDDLMSDTTKLKSFATDKTPSEQEMMYSITKRDRVEALNNDTVEQAEYLDTKYGPGDYD